MERLLSEASAVVAKDERAKTSRRSVPSGAASSDASGRCTLAAERRARDYVHFFLYTHVSTIAR